MSKMCTRVVRTGLAVFLLSLPSSGANARHDLTSGLQGRSHGKYQFGDGDHRRKRDLRSVATYVSAGSGALGSLMGDLIGECNRQMIELKNLPIDSIALIIRPDAAQADALKDIGRTAEGLADALVANCATQAPAAPPSRLAAVERGIEAVETATATMRGPLDTFYQLLRDEQRKHLVTRMLAGDSVVTDAAQVAKASPGNNDNRGNETAGGRGWDCELWVRQLRIWPVLDFEQSLHLSARQRAVFHELVASFQFAADTIEDSCPREALPTPMGRLLNMTERLEVLHQSVVIIRAPLGYFYEVLDDGQKARFGAEM